MNSFIYSMIQDGEEDLLESLLLDYLRLGPVTVRPKVEINSRI